MTEPYDLCVDAYVHGERFDPSMLPRPTDLLHAPPEELALAWRRQWQPGQELRIRFLDGEPDLHDKVRAHAEAGTQLAEVRQDPLNGDRGAADLGQRRPVTVSAAAAKAGSPLAASPRRQASTSLTWCGSRLCTAASASSPPGELAGRGGSAGSTPA